MPLSDFASTTEYRSRNAEEVVRAGLSDAAVHVTSATAAAFRFPPPLSQHPALRPCAASDGSVGVGEMFDAMSAAIPATEQPSDLRAWVENHYRWIVWKCASLERSFSDKLAGVRLTAAGVYVEKILPCKRRWCVNVT